MTEKDPTQRHTIKGHLRILAIAGSFGLAAYVVLRLFMWLTGQFEGLF